MNHESTGTAQAIDAEFTDIPGGSLERVGGGVPQVGSAGVTLMSPAQLREQIEHHKGLMQVLKDYVRSEMVENHDYYFMSRISNPNAELRQGEKPALMQDGAFKFLNLFRYIPGTVRKSILRTADGHFTVEAEAPIYNANGQLVATGDGSCSTRESKYAFRKGERTCPDCDQPTIRKDKKIAGAWYCWSKIGGCGATFGAGTADSASIEAQNVTRVENPDIADVENTVLKMAIKRATVAAVRKLPLVSELFEGMDGSPGGGNDIQTNKPKNQNSAPRTAAKAPQSSAPAPQAGEPESVVRACQLSQKLQNEHGCDAEELRKQFLPDGVKAFSDLNADQAAEVVPKLAWLLTAKVSSK